jgi:hypothetical protein
VLAFQPHRYTRTRDLLRGLREGAVGADALLLPRSIRPARRRSSPPTAARSRARCASRARSSRCSSRTSRDAQGARADGAPRELARRRRAARFYAPADLEDLQAFLAQLPPREPLLFVGLGSNLLVRDGGFAGTVVLTHAAGRHPQMVGGRLYAEAGVASPKVARFAARHDLAGAEFLAGVPGTVGGALAMNAGCYGGETWDIVERAVTIDRRGELRTRGRDDFEIGYRHCALRAAHGWARTSGSPPRGSICAPGTARPRARASASCWRRALRRSRFRCPTRAAYSATRREIMRRA